MSGLMSSMQYLQLNWIICQRVKIFTSTFFNKNHFPLEFIPARESKLFTFCFKWYAWLLFRRRFKRVWIKQEYHPGESGKTIYFLNHHSWWDGLIPLLLNEFRFHQKARAMMEDSQMERYGFFRKIGAFSVNRSDPRKAITSLRYAVQSMERETASLFIYPEGTITPSCSEPAFEGGLAWLHSKLRRQRVDFVPVAVHIHTIRFDKPELHLHVGQQVQVDPTLSNRDQTELFENSLKTIVGDLRNTAGFEDEGFERLL